MSAQPLFAAAHVPEQVAWTSLLPLLFLAVLAVFGWTTILRRRRANRELLPETPHPLVPWDGGLTLLSSLVYLGFWILGTGLLAGIFYNPNDLRRVLPENSEEALADPQWMIAAFQAHTLTSYAAAAAIVALLIGNARAGADDLGLTLPDGNRFVRIGLVAFAVIVPPLVVLQGLLNALWMDSQHPIIVAYRASGDATLLLWSSVTAVLVAPFTEELFFRVVLQGWLERVIAKREQPLDADVAEDEAAPLEVRPPDQSSVPIVISSTLFALVHIGSGPDVVPIFFLALGLGYLYRQTHSIWPGFIVHTLLNAWSMVVLMLMP